MINEHTLRVAGIVNDSIVDGPGLRLAVFLQGCPHLCKGCHNPQSHDENGGYVIYIKDILAAIKKNPLLDGVTFTGGEPLLQYEQLTYLSREIKKLGLNIVVYTGYTWEEIMEKKYADFLNNIDILIDGLFVNELKSYSQKFKGSLNQRIIDVKRSLKEHRIIEHIFE